MLPPPGCSSACFRRPDAPTGRYAEGKAWAYHLRGTFPAQTEERDMDDFQKAVKTCFRKYADFSGRAARPEFWWFMLFQIIVSALLGIISAKLQGLGNLVMLLPGLAVGARRLHDINKTAWLLLLWLIPVIGWILLIYWAIQPGGASANDYGEPPADRAPREMVPGQQ
jgi:uncharacterized membrane protein YhaH (DUF805 family)